MSAPRLTSSWKNPIYRTVILYLHGNTAHRAGEHRKELYQVHSYALSVIAINHHFPLSKVLRKMNFHVVAFDYRGYADSSKHIAPTETGVVRDARAVYDWLCSRAGGKVGAFWISSTLPKQLE